MTFSALTGTSLAGFRKRDRWLSYAASLNASESLRTAAVRTEIGKSTSFR